MRLLEDKVVVTGAAGGIGSATADRVHEEGGTVVAIGRNAAEVETIRRTRVDRRWSPIELDVTDHRAVDSTFAAIVERFGRIDGLCE